MFPPVSIPFIAGQWSLPINTRSPIDDVICLNPLHCGAVVASESPSGHGTGAGQGLNPLHCGAVVASRPRRLNGQAGAASQSPSLRGSGRFSRSAGSRSAGSRVSIPFIAGQWSLPWHATGTWKPASLSQSPSLRGSGRFTKRRTARAPRSARLNPLHCGAVVASPLVQPSNPPTRGSLNPLHCGAVVASGRSFPPWPLSGPRSQSPSLRGSGRFKSGAANTRSGGPSLNPLHCGAVVASAGALARPRRRIVSQSPSLRGSGRFRPHHNMSARRRTSLNPLHCGAVVASPRLPHAWPDHRPACLNPLHCGAVVASLR